jgi:Zn finger protein HypA/HybF involved in hydrogenase expression
MMEWLKQRLGIQKAPTVRHCRECGAVVPAAAGLCPHCHSMDIEDGPPNAHQQKGME